MSAPQVPAAIRAIKVTFAPLRDSRVLRTQHHPFINVLVMALCGAICGADGWKGLAHFARAKATWFATFLDMPHGAPSADTFRRVLGALDPAAFEACFRQWVGGFAEGLKGEVVAFDGKTVRGALERAASKSALHLLHAWATGQHLLLGQVAVEGAPGEVSGLVQLIGLLDLQGAVVTADANGCADKVARACRAKGADYLLALKGNRAALHGFVASLFAHVEARARADTQLTGEVGHGRAEVREVWAVEPSDWPVQEGSWPGLRSAVLIERERLAEDGRPTLERHYYLSSLAPDAEQLARAARSHWGVENGLHWCLDVGFNEDRRRIRQRNGAQNYALLCRMALMMLKRDKSVRAGIALKRQEAGWHHPYLLHLLASGAVEL
jgi:predicted transposase YbfD/YdcC